MIRLLNTFAVIVSKGKAMTAVPFKNNVYNYDVFRKICPAYLINTLKV